jgi:hypothetical protein
VSADELSSDFIESKRVKIRDFCWGFLGLVKNKAKLIDTNKGTAVLTVLISIF